jgi:hypothetical protein
LILDNDRRFVLYKKMSQSLSPYYMVKGFFVDEALFFIPQNAVSQRREYAKQRSSAYDFQDIYDRNFITN